MIKNRGNAAVILLAVCVSIVVLAGGYFWWQNQSPKLASKTTTLPTSTCQSDSDCQLVVKDSWSNCALGPTCERINYSQDKWIAINWKWYSQVRNKTCPPDKYPAPGCAPKPINDDFTAKCVSNLCQKCPPFPGCPPPGSLRAWSTCWGDFNTVCPASN